MPGKVKPARPMYIKGKTSLEVKLYPQKNPCRSSPVVWESPSHLYLLSCFTLAKLAFLELQHFKTEFFSEFCCVSQLPFIVDIIAIIFQYFLMNIISEVDCSREVLNPNWIYNQHIPRRKPFCNFCVPFFSQLALSLASERWGHRSERRLWGVTGGLCRASPHQAVGLRGHWPGRQSQSAGLLPQRRVSPQPWAACVFFESRADLLQRALNWKMGSWKE